MQMIHFHKGCIDTEAWMTFDFLLLNLDQTKNNVFGHEHLRNRVYDWLSVVRNAAVRVLTGTISSPFSSLVLCKIQNRNENSSPCRALIDQVLFILERSIFPQQISLLTRVINKTELSVFKPLWGSTHRAAGWPPITLTFFRLYLCI